MELIAYASRTGTKRNLAALRAHGWRLLVSAAGVWRTEGFAWAADNGQWSERDEVGPFKADRFKRFVSWCMEQPILPDWIVLPDIVQGGAASLRLTMRWLRWFRTSGLLRRVRVLIAVQDGMERGVMFDRIRRVLGARVGLFVGGSTEWKVETMGLWCRVARVTGAICHIGRVNSMFRIGLCEDVGATSFDGSNASRFSKNTPKLDAARRQGSFMGMLARMEAA